MNLPVLVQPPPRGRISGGFLYNARLAGGGLWEVRDLAPERLPSLREGVAGLDLLLMDSIWLTREHAPLFLSLKPFVKRLGLVLHAFPSMIEAAENGPPPLTEPTTFEREVIDELDVVLLPGPHHRDLLARAKSRIVIAEPGVDDAWRAPPRPRNGPCRLVSVGAVTPLKGFLDVAEALSQFVRADYTWSVVGSLDVDPAYSARLIERARPLPVTLCGQVPPVSVRRIVQGADLFLMPSYIENQPLVLMEAMAASVPAVAYAAGASRLMLQDGQEGFINAIGDKIALAQRLELLLDDEQLRYRFAQACWRRQRSFQSWGEAARHARVELEQALAS